MAVGIVGIASGSDEVPAISFDVGAPDQAAEVVDTTLPSTTSTVTSTSEPSSSTQRQPWIYVDPAGDDSRNGQSSAQSVRTPERALALAEPGDTLLFAAGRYGPLVIEGREDLEIRGLGEGDATFSSGSYEVDAGIHVRDSSMIVIVGLAVRESLWGVQVERSSDVAIDRLDISDLGQEAIHVWDNSTRVSITRNTISDTGNRPGDNGRFPYSTFGEGIYLGSGSVLGDGTNDETSDVLVEANLIERTSAEAIDIKPFVRNVTVTDNVVRDVATATSGAVVVGIGPKVYPDPSVVISRNVILDVSRTSQFRDGNAIRVSSPALVAENIVIGAQHHGIVVDDQSDAEGSGLIRIVDNLVARTGLEAISDQSGGALTVEIEGNETDLAIDDLAVELARNAAADGRLWAELWPLLTTADGEG